MRKQRCWDQHRYMLRVLHSAVRRSNQTWTLLSIRSLSTNVSWKSGLIILNPPPRSTPLDEVLCYLCWSLILLLYEEAEHTASRTEELLFILTDAFGLRLSCWTSVGGKNEHGERFFPFDPEHCESSQRQAVWEKESGRTGDWKVSVNNLLWWSRLITWPALWSYTHLGSWMEIEMFVSHCFLSKRCLV